MGLELEKPLELFDMLVMSLLHCATVALFRKGASFLWVSCCGFCLR